jgi:hypothetical protein
MFHIGRAPTTSQRQQQQQRRRRSRRIISKPTSEILYPWTFGKSWLLIPRKQLSAYQYIILINNPHNFKGVYTTANDIKEKFPEDSKEYQFLRAFHKSTMTYQEIQTHVYDAYMKNQHIRFAFKRLLNRWVFRRILIVNTIDVVTQELIKQPVSVYDWAVRKCYLFEAHTILRDSTLRLLNHDCMMMESLPPRNILTNMKFTEGQCISVYTQMLKYGVTNTHWESFASSGFNIRKLLYTHEVPMRLECLKTFFKGYSYENADLVIDFIDLQYANYNELLPDEKLLYCLIRKHWNHPYIKSWVHLCKQYWDAQIRPHAYTESVKKYINQQSYTLIYDNKITWHTLS